MSKGDGELTAAIKKALAARMKERGVEFVSDLSTEDLAECANSAKADLVRSLISRAKQSSD